MDIRKTDLFQAEMVWEYLRKNPEKLKYIRDNSHKILPANLVI